jgi:NitT/TauT family transport system permease protein
VSEIIESSAIAPPLVVPRRRFKSIGTHKWTLRILSVALVLVVWELYGRSNPIQASYPSAIGSAARHDFSGTILPAFRETLSSFFLGYGIAIVVGIPLGLLMARMRVLEVALMPYVSALYSTPIVVFIPLLIIWLGITFSLRVWTDVLLGVWPIVLNTYLGAKEVDRDQIDAGVAFAGSRLQILRTIIVPGSLHYIFSGLRLGFSRSMIATIVVEMEASIVGIGALIKTDAQTLQLDDMWVVIIMLGTFNVLFTSLIKAGERWTTEPWNRKGKVSKWLSRP